MAESASGYERGLAETIGALEACEELLANRPFLAGSRLTEVDLCAFPTLVSAAPTKVKRSNRSPAAG